MENNEENTYGWIDWEKSPTDEDNVHYLTIVDPDGEELAVIVHRASDQFPLDGEHAESKCVRAQFIVDALNKTL